MGLPGAMQGDEAIIIKLMILDLCRTIKLMQAGDYGLRLQN